VDKWQLLLFLSLLNVMVEEDSTVLPSTEISGGLGPEIMFCSFVFGQEMLSPRCEAESRKLLSDVVAPVADGRSKAVSSA